MIARWVVVVAACAPATTETVQDITNGTLDEGDPGVVGLVAHDQITCTGTLVAPQVVITAAHCVVGTTIDRVVIGGDVAGRALDVVHVHVHPAFEPVVLDDDLAVVLVGEPAGVAPVAMLDVDPGLVDRTVRVVGFGQQSPIDQSLGRKRTGTATIRAAADTRLELAPDPSLTCGGDSGGPALLAVDGTEYLAGVTSGGDANCAVTTRSTRVDRFVDFVRGFVDATAPGSAALGDRCHYAAQCTTGTCVFPADAPRIGYCSMPCERDAECGTMRCLEHACRYPAPSPGALGASCGSYEDCDARICARGTCSEVCTPDAPSCPTGFACLEGDQPGLFACFAAAPSGGGGCATTSDGGGVICLLCITFMSHRRRRRHGS